MPVPANVPAAATYGSRPEHPCLDPAVVEIEVVVLEPAGSETLVIARLGNRSLTVILRQRITAAAGSTLRVLPDLSAIHFLLDREGTRLDQ